VPYLLSAGAERFLHDSIFSALQLDALIVLHADRERWWTAAAMAGHLRASNVSTGQALEALGASNVVDVRITGSLSYRYAPLDRRLEDAVDEIAAVHHHARAELLARVTADRTPADGVPSSARVSRNGEPQA
jgi:hypothetical protein